MAKLNIPRAAIDTEPLDAIRTDDRGFASEVIRMYALTYALRGLELGTYDHRVMDWLAGFEPSTVAVVCSWLERARAQGAKPTAGGPEPPKFTTTEAGPHARYGLPSWSQD